jgi:hypothetical protein
LSLSAWETPDNNDPPQDRCRSLRWRTIVVRAFGYKFLLVMEIINLRQLKFPRRLKFLQQNRGFLHENRQCLCENRMFLHISSAEIRAKTPDGGKNTCKNRFEGQD